jgi:hypothetical protein
MTGVAVVDTNLLVLLIVGSAGRHLIAAHKRLDGFTTDDFDELTELVGAFDDIVLLPHILTEACHLVRLISGPARRQVNTAISRWVGTVEELPLASIHGATRPEFDELGLTDSMILHLLDITDLQPTLITVDHALANKAAAAGYDVIDYREQFQTR